MEDDLGKRSTAGLLQDCREVAELRIFEKLLILLIVILINGDCLSKFKLVKWSMYVETRCYTT